MATTKRSTQRIDSLRQRRAKRTRRIVPLDSGAPPEVLRHNEARQRREKRRSKDTTVNQPPVMARGGLGATPPLSRKRVSTPRRRYDVSLNVPGAEVRLPSLPAVRVGWRLFSGILFVMMLFSLFSLWKSPAFVIENVEMAGLQRLTAADINTVLGVIGESVFLVDPSAKERDLRQAFPELSEVRVRVGLPAKVDVTLVERQPVLSWIQEGREMWVDQDGVAFPPRGNPGSLVRVEANNTPPLSPGVEQGDASAEGQGKMLSTELVAAILAMYVQVPRDTLLLYDRDHGLGWDDVHGWRVYFGMQVHDIAMKLAVYQALADRLESEGIRPTFISVEYVHAPYYRMER